MDIEKFIGELESMVAPSCKDHFAPKFFELRKVVEENARLRAEIDAADAQKPIYQAQTVGGFWSDVTAENYAKHAIWRIVYARPIPAQQSPAVVVPETISDQLENFICYLIDKEEGAIIAEETLHHQLAAFLSNEKYNKPSPRITEQDALKAVWSHGYETGHNDGIGCGHSLAPRCRHSGENEYDAGDVAALLNKLNKVNHETN